MAYNHITLVGNLTKNPETKTVGKKQQTKFTIAVERWTATTKNEFDYFNIVTSGKLAEVCNDYLKKGKKLLVDGRVQVRKESTGNWVTEIIADNVKFLTSK